MLCSLALVFPVRAWLKSIAKLRANRLIVDQRENLEIENATDMRELRLSCSIAFDQQLHEKLYKNPFTIQFSRQLVEMLTV